MKKKVLIGGIILLLMAAGYFTWSIFVSSAQSQTAVQTFTLKKGDLVDSVLVSGTVKSSKSENVYSRVTNYPIKKVNVEVGDKVKAGDILAQLDTASLEFDIRQSEINMETASIELKNSQKSFDQTKILYDAGASSQDEFLKAQTALEKAQLSYKNAKNSLENAKNKNNDAKITAPIDGTVTLVNAKEGGSAAGLLFFIEDTDNLIVSTQIGEYDISLVKLGQEAIIKADSTGDKQFMGTVSKIAPTAVKDANGNIADTSNIQFDTEIALKDKEPNIKIGMTMRLTIKLNEKKDVYSVPHEALVTEADGSHSISVLEASQNGSQSQNVSRKIKVQTGMETDMYVEISSPDLQDGMNVSVSSKDSNQESR